MVASPLPDPGANRFGSTAIEVFPERNMQRESRASMTATTPTIAPFPKWRIRMGKREWAACQNDRFLGEVTTVGKA